MKRKLLVFLLMFATVGILSAQQVQVFDRDYDTELRLSPGGNLLSTTDAQPPIFYSQSVSTNAFSLYFINTTTNTSADYAVGPSSIQFRCAGGLYAGTTTYWFADADKNTIGELVTYINNLSTSIWGVEGGIVATISQGMYEGNFSTGMALVSTTSVYGIANKKDVYFSGERNGMTYTIPASTNGDKTFLSKVLINATFSTAVNCYIYDSSTTARQIWQETIPTTATDKVLNINEDCVGSANTAMRIDIWGAMPMTNAYLGILYKKRQ
jgi:hypothetical protein